MTGAVGESAPGGTHALYVVATWVPRRLEITVGALGPVTFARGWYAYVGSARRGRDARVARHIRREKPLRWHADYLFAAAVPRLAWLVDGRLSECELAGALAAQPGAARPVRRFGAGDCQCAGHLILLGERPSTAMLRASLAAAGGGAARPVRSPAAHDCRSRSRSS